MSGARVSSRPGVWAGLYLSSAAVIAALRISDAIDSTTAFILFAAASVLLIPYVRAFTRRNGSASAAIVRYSKGIAVSSLLYVLALGFAITLDRRMEISGAAAVLLALLPALPILGMIWVMGRYLVEERDEYLRYRAMIANVIGLGAVLAAGSFWGFLEQFELVPHVPAWWTVPVWAIGMGLGQCWMALKDRGGEGV